MCQAWLVGLFPLQPIPPGAETLDFPPRCVQALDSLKVLLSGKSLESAPCLAINLEKNKNKETLKTPYPVILRILGFFSSSI